MNDRGLPKCCVKTFWLLVCTLSLFSYLDAGVHKESEIMQVLHFVGD